MLISIPRRLWTLWLPRLLIYGAVFAGSTYVLSTRVVAETPWPQEWPKTDFSKRAVALEEIRSGGPPKDGIPAVDRPRFVTNEAAARWLDPREPVIVFEHRGDTRAYPLQILMFHEIVNDTVGGAPIAVFTAEGMLSVLDAEIIRESRRIPAAAAYSRKLGDRTLAFELRDARIIDRETGSEWDIFGKAVAGSLKGKRLTPADSGVHFAFAWLAFNPDSEIYSAERARACNGR